VLTLRCELPDDVAAMPEAERETRCVLGDENCAIGDERFFLRGNLGLRPPALGGEELVCTLWVELERKAYKRALGLFGAARRADEPAIPCRVANALPGAAWVRGAEAELVLGPAGRRAEVRLKGR
jgi:hypothetical protein